MRWFACAMSTRGSFCGETSGVHDRNPKRRCGRWSKRSSAGPDMARFLFLSWNGAGNQPPAVGIAQALAKRGHAVTFAGYENQRGYFTTRGFRFVLLERASAAWRDEPL